MITMNSKKVPENPSELAQRFMLDAWKAELVGNLEHAQRFYNLAYRHDESLEHSPPSFVKVDGIRYSRTCEAHDDSTHSGANRIVTYDPDCDEVRNADISLPRCVTYEYLCNSQIWITDVLNSPETSFRYFQHSKPATEIKYFISHC
jgi:hypothetical protein